MIMVGVRFFAVVAVMALALGCVSAEEMHDPRFEDPRLRGTLTDIDVLAVPPQFRGLWAKPESACRGAGVRIDISERRIGEAALLRLQGYSDDPTAAMIELGRGDWRGYLFIEMSHDGRLLRVKRREERQPFGDREIFHLCFAERGRR